MIKIKKVIHYDDRGFPYVKLKDGSTLYSDYRGRLWYINPSNGMHNSIISHYSADKWTCDRTFNTNHYVYREIMSLLNRDIKEMLWNVNPENLR